MKITIRVVEGITYYGANFYERADIENYFGYDVLRKVHYKKWSNDTSIDGNVNFRCWNPVGFFGNNPVSPFADHGTQQNGIRFRNNRINEKTISFQFEPVIQKSLENPLSPLSVLNKILMTNDSYLTVFVTTDKTYYQTFYVTENTNTDNGVIELKTRLPHNVDGPDYFWKTNERIQRYFFNFYKVDELLKNHFSENKKIASSFIYPFKLTVHVMKETDIKITISGNNTGFFKYFRIANDRQMIEFNNIDLKNTTVTFYSDYNGKKNYFRDATGKDVSAQGSGSMVLKEGNNTLSWYMNMPSGTYDDANENLPENLSITYEYTNYVYSIEEEYEE